jgi:hypothetical protein
MEREFSIVGAGCIGNLLHDQTEGRIYDRDSAKNLHQSSHDIIVITAPSSNRLYVKDHQQLDLKNCDDLVNLLQRCRYRALVHISTVDVYHDRKSDSALPYNIQPDAAYGHNRWYLEQKLQQFENCHSIRLPTLIHSSVKKNLLFDIKNMIWLDKINLENQNQWYPLTRLKQDIVSVVETNSRFENFTSEPIKNIEIVSRYRPNLIKILEKNQSIANSVYDVRSSQCDYQVSTPEIWSAFDQYFEI